MGLNERIGHKKANFVRLGLKAGAVLGAVAGINLGKKAGETHFEEYKSKEQQKQRGGLVPPAPPPPPSKPALIGKVVGVAVGQASLKEELVSAGKDYYERSLSRDEADKKFREAQRQRSQSASTTAEGGVGSTEASTKDLLRIGKRKAVKKIKFWR